MNAISISKLVAVSGALADQALRICFAILNSFISHAPLCGLCPHNAVLMLTLSTPICKYLFMTQERKTKVRPYHHGNLPAALIDAGLKLIEKKGVRALTLREIGAR